MTPFLLWHLLAHCAHSRPDQSAVVDGALTLTYGALEAQSNQLAAFLQAQGIGPGARVGIYLPKSAVSVVAIFGILKAGAAYVPLDPAAPVTRSRLIVEDCQLAGLISDGERLAALLPGLDVAPPLLVAVDDRDDLPSGVIHWSGVLQWPTLPPPDSGAIEKDLAYLLYTSGSTGRPKGVMISHRAALTFVNWAADYFGIQPTDRLANHAPLHFDLSIFDLFAAMSVGATVCLVPGQTAIFPYALAEWMAEQRISVWYSVPSALVQLLLYGELESHDLSALRLLLFAGEVFPVKHLRQLQGTLPRPAYYNLYGPTETNVCTVYPVPLLDPQQNAPCPIGIACANTQVFALDEAGKPITAGGSGELYVRGPGLMDGYWRLPEQTATVLLPNPLNPASAERVYRTGDWVRLEADGHYTFVGRRDGMVKSRGYRIELGEIEAALLAHPAVVEAAVIPIPDEEIGNRLLAFVVIDPDQPTGPGQLLAHCRTALPGYMLPEKIEMRQTLPKTSTGKMDRRALSAEAFRRNEIDPVI